MKSLLYPCVVVCLTALSHADASAQVCPPTLANLKKLSLCELDRLFESATPGEIPVGQVRGHVLLIAGNRNAPLDARAADG